MSEDTGGAKKGGAKETFGAAKKAFNDSKSNGGQSNPNGGQVDDNQEEAGSVQDTARSSGKGKQGAKSAKNAAKSGKRFFNGLKGIKTLAPLVSVLSAIGIALLIIFLIIGFVGFFTTLPGLAMEKFTDNARSFLGWLLGSKNIEVSNDQITSLAKYIEELGYSLEGCGFVPVDSVKRADGKTGEIEKIECDVQSSNLYAYILANEKTYTVELEGKSVLGVAQDVLPYATLLLPPPMNVIGGTVALARTVTEIYEYFDIQTKGMLIFDDLDADINTSVQIDRVNNKLIVKEGFFQVDQVNYDLNGWTGRYGKPIELSLALHLSTMAPDFVRNFCLNDDLQTEVHISTVARDYDINYYFETEDGTILDKSKVNEAYESLKTAIDVDQNYSGTDWRSAYDNQTEVSLFTEDGNIEFPYVPIQMLDDLNTISFTYQSDYSDLNSVTNSEWIAVVGSDGNPVSFYDSNGNARNIVFDVEGVTVNDNGKFSKTPICNEGELDKVNVYRPEQGDSGYVSTITIDEIIKIRHDGFNIRFQEKEDTYEDYFFINSIGLSMNGLITRINNGSFSQDDSVYEELEFLMMQVDKLVYDIKKYTNEKEDVPEDLKELCERFIAKHQKNYGKWYESDGGYYSEKFKSIINDKMDAKERVEKLEKLRSDCKSDYEIIQEAVMLIQNDSSETLDECGGISVSTLKLLHDFFNGEADEIETYEPYITSVEHHWYKDAYFVDENGSKDGFYDLSENSNGETITKKEEYNPEGLAADDETLNKLSKEGTIYVEMKGKFIEQLKTQPQFVQNEPWHYMVKNWLTNGYFFIYDGTVETAREIESAKKYLQNFGYDQENPLLVDYDNTGLLVDDNKEIINTATVEEIESEAKRLNEELANADYIQAQNGGKSQKYKVRLQKINFAKKSSLAAFSILEGVHTEDGESVYHDLKEFLIELGYFSEGDFETIESNVLEWMIPSYTPDKWPDPRYEKKNNEYSTYIRSKSSIEAEKQEEKSKLEKLEAQNPDNTIGDGTTGNGNSNSSMNEQDSTTSASGVVKKKINASDYGEEGYATITTVNGVSYKDYKQGNYPKWGASSQYSQEYPSKSTDMFGNVGCGPTSAAIVLSAYGKVGSTGKKALPYLIGEEIGVTTSGTSSANAIKNAFDNRGVAATVYNKSDSNLYDIMDKALKEGRPIVANVNAGSYSPGGHYIAILGYDSDNNLVISNPCGNGTYGNTGKYNPGPVSLKDFISKHLGGGSQTLLIPDIAPSGISSISGSSSIEGFEEELEVIAPEQCIVTNFEKGDSADSITIKFISSNKVKDMTMKIEGIKLTDNIEKDLVINKGEVIGKTTQKDIKLLMRDSKKAIINNIEDYMQPPEKLKKIANGSSGTIPLFSTILSRQEFIDGANNYSGIAGTEFEGKMGEFYDICTKNGINPVIAFTRAIWESGLTHDGGTHNYWGINIPNGSGYVGVADSMLGTLQVYCDLLNSYSDPTTWQYKTIMERYNERKDCTENGGCSTSGYGTPDTIEGIMSLYSALGKHEEGSSGAGGYYYLDPDRAGVTAIYETHEEFVSLCKNKHSEGSEVTVWENAQYTAYQVKLMADTAESLWGERALK